MSLSTIAVTGGRLGTFSTTVRILPVVLKVFCGKTKLMSIRQGKNYKIAAFVEKKLVTAEEGKE